MNEIDNRKLFGADDPPPNDDEPHAPPQLTAGMEAWAEGEVVRILQAENAKWKQGLTDIANADGMEARVLSDTRQIMGYEQGVKTQAQRARAALGDSAPPEYPPSVLLSIIERLKAALTDIATTQTSHGCCKWCGANLEKRDRPAPTPTIVANREHSAECPTIKARKALGDSTP